jgi:hypothetical protein
LVRAALRTPRAAAIAGILFSLILIASFWLLQISVPKSRFEVGEWLRTSSERIVLALNLIPIAGVAFLWFLGVLRDRLGAMEDKFFASVFLGSALLFLGMLFVAASAGGALVGVYAAAPNLADPSGIIFARAFPYDVVNIYAMKMAAVFMMTTSTLALRTHITASWIAWVGYASAAFVLIGSGYFGWAFFVFPLWVLLVSIYILVDNLRNPPRPQ